MNKTALAIAAFLAATCTALLLVYLNRIERETSGGERVRVLALVKSVERGQMITDDMLATRAVPMAYVEDRSVKAPERPKVLGLQAAHALSPQQLLLWTDLAITTEERELSSLVQPGKRGVTVQAAGANEGPGNALIRPGDYVDVIVTSVDAKDLKDQSASVLLQRVLVLAVGQETGQIAGSADLRGRESAIAERLLTLSLNLSEAQLLALALEKGRLSVAVRNVGDPAIQGDVPDVNATALFTGRVRVEPKPVPRAASGGPVAIGGFKR
ncbi:MAG TPA: Flp pilus assembly protein CpaB [Polyangiaceae bacterium]|nr:Flp pilus assembly protein CpaB [Polyangiaceae bacterium]